MLLERLFIHGLLHRDTASIDVTHEPASIITKTALMLITRTHTCIYKHHVLIQEAPGSNINPQASYADVRWLSLDPKCKC